MLRPLSALLLLPMLLLAAMPAFALDRHGSTLQRYNFPTASRGDRFAPDGISLRHGRIGWKRFGPLIKRVAKAQHINPFVLGAYIWLESGFDPDQDYKHNKLRAIGLGSVQPSDYPWYSLKELAKPELNLKLTAREFRHKWKPHDMAATVMDVWFPRWRVHMAAKKPIPVVGTPRAYVQAIANRYFALQRIDGRLFPPKVELGRLNSGVMTLASIKR